MHTLLKRAPKLAPLAAAVLFAFPAPAWSAAGKVVFTAGDVRVSSGERPAVALTRGAELEQGDLLSTGANGFAQLLMEDGGRVTVRANSRLRLDEFRYDAGNKGKGGRSVMSLLTGSMRAITGWIGHNDRASYKIKTPTATIGIRGSDGNVGYDALIGASVQTLAGGHTLTGVDSRGQEHTLILNPGEVGLLPPGSAAPVRVEQFPFSTAQPAQAASRPAAAPATADVAARKASTSGSATETKSDATVTAAPAPSLNDASGAIVGVDASGQTVALTPAAPPVAPVPVGTGSGLIGLLTANTMASGYFFLDDFGGDGVKASDVIKNDKGHLTGYALGHDKLAYGDVSIRNAIADPVNAIETGSGVSMGVWRGRADNGSSVALGYTLSNAGRMVNWAYAEAGYYDRALPLSGEMNYTGHNLGGHGYGEAGAVKLTDARLRADFTAHAVDLSLGIKVGATEWTARTGSGKPMALYQQGANGFDNGFSGHAGHELEISNTLGQSTAAQGHVRGSFTGANFSGALLEYDFMQQADADGELMQGVKGIVGFKPDTPVGGGIVPTPANKDYVVVSDLDGAGGTADSQIVSRLDTVGHSGWTYAVNDKYSIEQRYAGSGTQVNAAWGNGIRSGWWKDGSLTTAAQYTLGANESFAWGTIAKPSGWYLPALLTGSARYTVDRATTPGASDGSAWTLDATRTELTVDFTRQRVKADLSLRQADDLYTLSAADAELSGPDGHFNADRYDGDLRVTRNAVDITDNVYHARLRGELGGKGLSAALMGYNLGLRCGAMACPDGQVLVSGMVAFKGPEQDENQAYAIVNVAANTSAGNLSGIGFDAAGSVQRDGGGGVRGFDIWSEHAGRLRYEAGAAGVKDQGSHAATGLSWGRWDGTASVSVAGGDVKDGADNVHYILSNQTGPVQLPLSGTFDYAKVGHTAPTDLQGNTGVLDTALLRADFTQHVVDVKIQATVNGTTLSGVGNGVGLFGNAFQASSDGSGTGLLKVDCAGSCGAMHDGSVTGHFTGSGASGAGVTYALGSDNGAAINGAVGFQRVGP